MDLKVLEEAFSDYQVTMRRRFHRHPELGGRETETARVIREELTKAGIEWRACGKELSTGTLATVQGARPGKTILLRGDIDALPVQERTGLPFASEVPGCMHACGHDCHASMLLTAARMLQQVRDELSGTVKLLFQPAEEIARGARDMIAAGAISGVDAIFGMHVWSEIPSGQVSLKAGGRMAATDRFTITLKGKGGHAALPHKCADVSMPLASILLALQSIVSRETDPVAPAVVTVGKVTSGTAWNVISGEAEIVGTVRTLDEASRGNAEESLQRISREIARAYRCEAQMRYERLGEIVMNDPELVRVAGGAAEKVLGKGWPSDYPPSMGGEDFGFYCGLAPSAFALFGVGNPACGAFHPQHSDRYTVDEPMLVKGALLYAQTAADFLSGR